MPPKALAFDLEIIKDELRSVGGDIWLTPEQAATVVSLSVKWFATARQTGVGGPPFLKLGTGRTSKIVYPLKEFALWQQSFKLHTNTSFISKATSFSNFCNTAAHKDKWLCALNGTELVDFATAVTSQKLIHTTKLLWLTVSEYQQKLTEKLTIKLSLKQLHNLKRIGNGIAAAGLQSLIANNND